MDFVSILCFSVSFIRLLLVLLVCLCFAFYFYFYFIPVLSLYYIIYTYDVEACLNYFPGRLGYD